MDHRTANIPLDEDLCMTLSDLFLGTGEDFTQIASVAKKYPIDFVEKTLFQYVAPACNYNTIYAEPIVIYIFDRKDLLKRINRIREKRKTKWGKIYYDLFSIYLKFKFNSLWKILKKYYYS